MTNTPIVSYHVFASDNDSNYEVTTIEVTSNIDAKKAYRKARLEVLKFKRQYKEYYKPDKEFKGTISIVHEYEDGNFNCEYLFFD